MKIEEKYAIKKRFLSVYFSLLFIGLLLTVGRWLSVPMPAFVLINAEIHSHISNLSLSMIFYLAIGHTWLLSGIKFRWITLLGLVILLGNLICETLLGFINTADIIDAVYGAIGTSIGLVYLFITYKFGLVELKEK